MLGRLAYQRTYGYFTNIRGSFGGKFSARNFNNKMNLDMNYLESIANLPGNYKNDFTMIALVERFESAIKLYPVVLENPNRQLVLKSVVRLLEVDYNFNSEFISRFLEKTLAEKWEAEDISEICKLSGLLRDPKYTIYHGKLDNCMANVVKNLSEYDIKNLKLCTITDLIKACAPIYRSINFIYDKNHSDLYKTSQKILVKKFQDFTKEETQYYASILGSFLCANKGNDIFLTPLQVKVFENLNELTDVQLYDLMNAHTKTISNDYNNFVFKIYAPVLNSFISRFETMETPLLIKFFQVLRGDSIIFGLYYNSEIEAKIKNLLTNKPLIQSLPLDQKIALHLNILSYANIVKILSEDLAMQVYNNMVENFSKFHRNNFISFGIYFARFIAIPSLYWRFIEQNAQSYEKCKDNGYKGILKMLLVQLHFSNPVMQSRLHRKFSMEYLDQITKLAESRSKVFVNSVKRSFEETIAEEVLKDLGVKFETEFYSLYSIDIAFPDKKIGLEMCGPKHYIWPAGELNGVTMLKIETLNRFGWKIYPIQFKPSMNREKRKAELRVELTEILRENSLLRSEI